LVQSHLSVLAIASWAIRVLSESLCLSIQGFPLGFPLEASVFTLRSWSILNWFLYRMRARGLGLVFWISSFPNLKRLFFLQRMYLAPLSKIRCL
jgi:hypothetical protein